MSAATPDKVFAGSIPKIYEQYLVPLIFEPYAEDLATRLAARAPTRVLEIAAGTGVVTRRLASVLPAQVSIVATDLNRPMLDLAAEIGTSRPVEWREADAMQLPFEDGAVRRRGLPVRSDVLPRQGQGILRSAPCSPTGRRVAVQRLGSNRGERIRRHGDDRSRIGLSRAIRRASWRERRTATTTSR